MANKMEDKRKRVVNVVAELEAGTRTLNKVETRDKVQVCSLALTKGIISVEDIPPRLCDEIALDLVKNAPWREMNEKAELGTEVHDWAEKLVLGLSKIEDVPEELRGHVDSFAAFWRDLDLEFLMTEFTVYNRIFGYAGTGDFMARSKKRPELGIILGDYKTSISGIWPDVGLQLAALANGEFVGLPNGQEMPMGTHAAWAKGLKRFESYIPAPDTGMGVQITAEGYSYVIVDIGEDVFSAFCSAIKTSDWTTTLSKTVLAQPISGGGK